MALSLATPLSLSTPKTCFLGGASAHSKLRALPSGISGVARPHARGVRSQFRDSDNDITGKVKQQAQDIPEKVKQQAQEIGGNLEKAFQDKKQDIDVQGGVLGTSGTLGFTKKNELFVGRMAMLGFASSLIGEALTGRGILGQFNIETGIPVTQAPPLLLAFITFNLVGAFTSGLGSQGYNEGDPAAAQKTRSIRGALGLAEKGPLFGFTRPNEFFNGRLAQLGFAISIVNEVITGRGAFGQIAEFTGLPVQTLEGLFLFIGPLMLAASYNLGEGRLVNDRDVQ